MFNQLKNAIQKRFDELADGETFVFYKDVDRDKVWDVYLLAFEPGNRQEHNCNSCKSFLRQFSGIVFIKRGVVESIWGIDVMGIDEEYRASITALQAYIASLPITNVFIAETQKLGTAKNRDGVRDIIWEHLSLQTSLRTMNAAAIPSKLGEYRTGKETLQRALNELTLDAAETIIELVAQNSLYRGAEFVENVKKFKILKIAYDAIPAADREAFLWNTSTIAPHVNGIRNTAIGTLLQDLSEGLDLDRAVGKYEAFTAPANYKRPSALVTPAMVNKAKETITELGFIDSLARRFANDTDLNINDVLFVDKASQVNDVFDTMAKETVVNPKTFSKIEEISIADFIGNVIPTAKSIEVLVENSHLNNFVSIITAQDPDAKSMFKWANPFSWAYTGGIADSMKERVKAAGGNVEGVLRFSIQWNDEETKGIVDFDAHAHEPKGEHICYNAGFRRDSGNLRTRFTGQLDVDMIDPPGIGVENITWTDINRMPEGDYKLAIHNYNSKHNTGFKAQVEFNGEIFEFHYPTKLTGFLDVATVTLKNGVFTLVSSLGSNSKVSSKQKWGINTNQFTKVKRIMLSPNHWREQTGNKHYMFLLDGAQNTEDVRPFFNEFLKPELNDHRKVFEVMAGKLTIPKSTNQLSGIGFSETIPNNLIVRVEGSFTRTLKIKF